MLVVGLTVIFKPLTPPGCQMKLTPVEVEGKPPFKEITLLVIQTVDGPEAGVRKTDETKTFSLNVI
jgi:hypothetical protein